MDVEEEATDAVTIGFTGLPDDVLVNIFSYHCSNYSALTRLESSCRRFRRVINNNENDSVLWDVKRISYHHVTAFQEIPENYKSQGLKTGKQVTRRVFALEKLHEEQQNVENIFVQELGLDTLKDLSNDIVRSRYFHGNIGGANLLDENGGIYPDHLDNDFEAQGDYEYTDQAIYGVTELIQDNIIDFLREEMIYLLDRNPEDCCKCLWAFRGNHHQREAWIPSLGSFDQSRLPRLSWDGSMENTQYWERNKIVRRLAYRAGLPEIPGSDTYESIWNTICLIALEFLYPVCVHKDAQRHQEQDDNDYQWHSLPITIEDINFHAEQNRNTNLRYKKLYVDSYLDSQDSEFEQGSTDDDEMDEDYSVYSGDAMNPDYVYHSDSDDSILDYVYHGGVIADDSIPSYDSDSMGQFE